MKRTLILGSIILAATTLSPLIAGPAAPSQAQQPGAAQQKPGTAAQTQERAQDMQMIATIRDLESAHQHLKQAPHEFGGHRTKAVQAVDQALYECHEALKWAESQNKK